MKKYIQKTAHFLLCVLLVSCGAETQEEIFKKTASEKLQSSISGYSKALTDSKNGWVLQYFPNETQIYGGYSYPISFDTEKKVTVWSELNRNLNDSQTSTYDVVGFGGPVLTFDTYNDSFMSYFISPSNSPELYKGRGGDYEFLLVSEEDDIITLKGAKTQNQMRLIKLKESPKAYLEKVATVKTYLDYTSAYVNLYGNITEISLFNRTISFKDPNTQKLLEETYVYTDKGIRLYKSISFGNNEVVEFEVNFDKKQLISLDGRVVIDIVRTPFELRQFWTLNTDGDASESVTNKFNDINTANEAQWLFTLEKTVHFGEAELSGAVEIGVMFGGLHFSRYLLRFSGVYNQPNQLNIEKRGGEFNWKFFGHLLPFVDFITESAPYVVETDGSTDPDEVKLTSVADPNIWFILKK